MCRSIPSVRQPSHHIRTHSHSTDSGMCMFYGAKALGIKSREISECGKKDYTVWQSAVTHIRRICRKVKTFAILLHVFVSFHARCFSHELTRALLSQQEKVKIIWANILHRSICVCVRCWPLLANVRKVTSAGHFGASARFNMCSGIRRRWHIEEWGKRINRQLSAKWPQSITNAIRFFHRVHMLANEEGERRRERGTGDGGGAGRFVARELCILSLGSYCVVTPTMRTSCLFDLIVSFFLVANQKRALIAC